MKDEKSAVTGFLFLVMGCGLVAYSLATLEMGTVLRMGPGFFPIVVGSGLALCGLAVLVTMGTASQISWSEWPWREIICIVAAILIFALTLPYLGFLAACFLMVFVAACARRQTSFLQAATIAVSMTAFCTVVFVWAIGVPLRLY